LVEASETFNNTAFTTICHRRKLEKLLDSKGSRTMPPPGLQSYLRPSVTLIFDLLTLDCFMSLYRGPLVLICIKISLFTT